MTSKEYQAAIDTFRIKIRRKHIDDLFSYTRKFFTHDKRLQQLKNKLKTNQQRIEYITDISRKLQCLPNQQWVPIFEQLYYLVKIYENQHTLWVTTGIIGVITSIFRLPQSTQQENNSYLYNKLVKIGCNILVDLLYLNSYNNIKIIKSLMYYEFVNNLIERLRINPSLQLLRMLASLLEAIPQLRQYLYEKKCLKIVISLITMAPVNERNSDKIYCCFVVLYSFIKIHEIDQNTSLNPRKSIVFDILSFISSEYQNPIYLEKIQMVMIKTLYQICRLNRQQIYDSVINHQPLVSKTISILIDNPANENRVLAGKLISQMLMSTDPFHVSKISEQGIIDIILKSYQSDKRAQVLIVFFSIIANLTADDPDFQDNIIRHPIFNEFIVYECQNSMHPDIRRQAVYCLCNFLNDRSPDFLTAIVMNSNILSILVENICKESTDSQTVKDILKTWKNMIENCSQTQENCVLNSLISYYRIQDILLAQEECDLAVDIEQFLDFLNNMTAAEFQIQ